MDPERLLPPFQKHRICVVGICTVDAIAQFVDQYPPRGGLRSFESLTLAPGGNAVNCALALARLGFAVDVITKVGGDAFGTLITSELRIYGVGTDGLITSNGRHTPFSFVCVHHDGQRSFLHTPGTNGTLALTEINLDLARSADLLLVTGTMLMPRLDGAPTAALLRAAREAQTVTILDTSYVDSAPPEQWRAAVEPCLPYLDYFVPSRLEAEALTGTGDLAKAAEMLLAFECKCVIIKLDREGVYYHDAAGSAKHIPAYQVEMVADTTGAGDCWCAGFLAGLAQESPLDEALLLGNAVASHCIQQAGASNAVPALEVVRRYQTSMGR